MVDEEAYRKWQEGIISTKSQKQLSDNQKNNDVSEGKDSADVQLSTSAYESQKWHQLNSLQQELITAVNTGHDECSRYLLKQLRVTEEAAKAALMSVVPPLPNPLTAAELKRMPRYAEVKVAESLDGILPGEAATPAFWAACHAVWIKQERFDDLVDCFLEGSRGTGDEEQTRNFLRRTGGLEAVRGKVSVLTNCPISMAWWRVRTAREAAEIATASKLDFSTAHELLHDTIIWEELTGLSVKRLTALNAPKARAASIVALWQRGSIGRTVSSTLRKAHCKGAFHAVARLSHSFSLNIIPWEKLLQAAQDGIKEADDNHLEVQPSDLPEEG
ncbi:hypothetical protein [Candidatus Poriferisocius sp.]|uniref:hypothetical protein n=1 Tax=Candidatus Poriferisocius sp. TaxID=3101276 RepID=UPI003B014914